ncbi:MAG TPA: alpha/beta hydrolase [Candidatus Methylomirabilis sp.]|nr:alpha/beta hydrolase [Candidatus Methylomirabilis sp.]
MKPSERTIAIRAGAVKFRVLSAGRGPALVYLHSFHDRSSWPPLLERLAERFTVHAPLHPGVRGSDGVEHLDDVVDLGLAYDELLGALRLDSTLVAGHFFGAMVAAELAALCPGRVRKLCLISPLGLWIDGKPVADVIVLPSAQLDALLWSDPESEAARSWRTWPLDEEENVAAQIEQTQRLAVMGKFVWPIPDKGLKKRLHRVTAPTLVLWGDDDRVNPDAYGQEFIHRIRRARFERLVGGHMLHLESMRAVAAAMTEFFASTRVSTARSRASRGTGSPRRTRPSG